MACCGECITECTFSDFVVFQTKPFVFYANTLVKRAIRIYGDARQSAEWYESEDSQAYEKTITHLPEVDGAP
jgi:hypothetical protein